MTYPETRTVDVVDTLWDTLWPTRTVGWKTTAILK